MTTMTYREMMAARRQDGPNRIPGDNVRRVSTPSQIRATMKRHNGRDMYLVTGWATVFDRGYPMWDKYGDYVEVIDSGALDKSLASAPDVAFLVNHRGMTMARTIPTDGSSEPTLYLDKDYTGLHIRAYLNPARSDVRDLMVAIDDGMISEMSWSFRLNAGEWNDSMDTFRITEADISRGDVSAVNYGACPYTQIRPAVELSREHSLEYWDTLIDLMVLRDELEKQHA